jgi:hypothetical protein
MVVPIMLARATCRTELRGAEPLGALFIFSLSVGYDESGTISFDDRKAQIRSTTDEEEP